MPRTNFENLRVYQMSEELADQIWRIVVHCDRFAKETVGRQMVRSADSIGANIAEGEGRRSFQDNRRFTKIARGSLQETQHWLGRGFKRNLLTTDQIDLLKPLIDQLAPSLNAYLRSIGTTMDAPNGKGQKTKD